MALTCKTREYKSELVDRSRRKNVSLGDCQIPGLKGTEHREPRHICSKERNVLIRVGEKEFHPHAIRHAQIDVEVRIELALILFSRHRRGGFVTAPRRLR